MYKVFFKDRILFLTDQIERDLSTQFNALHKYTIHSELQQFVQHFSENESLKIGYIYGKNLDFLFRKFSSCFLFLRAAGGFVTNGKDEFLGMERLGMNDLPKGKAEKGESIEATALREVEEECGISNLSIVSKICSTFHCYPLKDKLVLKETVWFKMSYQGQELLVPQLEENITQVKWYPMCELPEFANHTYSSIREVINGL